jgi:hypothetical protein
MSDGSARVTALIWGVKQSFRGYVEATGGTIEAHGGAERTADGAFAFPAAADSTLALGADGQFEGTGKFTGEAQFEAHGGMLSVRLADPVVEIGDAGAVLTLDDPRTGRVEIAKLDLAAAATEAGEVAAPAALSMDGSYALGGHYPAMTPIDPVRLQLKPA